MESVILKDRCSQCILHAFAFIRNTSLVLRKRCDDCEKEINFIEFITIVRTACKLVDSIKLMGKAAAHFFPLFDGKRKQQGDNFN